MHILDILSDLRQISATPGRGSTRLAYTHFEDEAHDYVWQHMQSVPGLNRVMDAAGNMFIVPSSALAGGRPILLMGSHLDTVIEGGWLDGTLGVAAGMYAVGRLAARGSDAGLVVFRDEEGVRFTTGLFGSRVFAGLCQEKDLAAVDRDGVAVRDVVPDAAGCLEYRPPVEVSGFLECHIEQGQRLTEAGKRIGVVTSIVGIRRFELVGTGAANHAGTTEMHRRVDALVPVATIVGRLPSVVDDFDDAVITCGCVGVEPGAANIIPGLVKAIVEIRAGDDETLDEIERRTRDLVESVEPPTRGGRLAETELKPLVTVEPTQVDSRFAEHLTRVLEERGHAHMHLSSMAGHDTQHAAQHCSAGMFFIPSVAGISHSPEEDSAKEDILLAGETMLAWAERCLS